MALVDLIGNFQQRQPNFVDTFNRARGQSAQINLIGDQRKAQQQVMQRQSALQSLLGQGAGAQQVAQAGFLPEAKILRELEIAPENKQRDQFLKEERSAATQDVRAFNKESKDMLSDYNSLNNNATLAKRGDRGARNAMTVSVGRLMSPGIFTETEASALSGGQTPFAAIIEAFRSKGEAGKEVLNNLSKYVDPYGESFNADGLLQIGENIVLSRTGPLLKSYEYSSERAKRSKMPEDQYNTIFGSNPYAPTLNELLNSRNAPGTQPQQQPQPVQQNATPQVMRFDAQGNLIR